MNSEEVQLAEHAIIGCMIDDPYEIDRLATRFRADHFLDQECRNVYSLLVDLRESGSAIDYARIIRDGCGRKIWNTRRIAVDAVAQLHSQRCSNATLEVFIRDVEDASRGRALTQWLADADVTITGAPDTKSAVRLLLAGLEAIEAGQAPEAVHMSDVVRRLADRRPDESFVVSTGFDSLDRCLGGFRAGQLIVLGARPSCGKSALGLQFAKAAAVSGSPSLFISIEMDESELGARAIAASLGCNVSELLSGTIDDGARSEIRDLADSLASVPWSLLEAYGPTVEELAASIRLAVARGTRLVVVDYVSLVVTDGNSRKSHVERIGEITKTLKRTARKCAVPIVLLAQLNRDVEGDGKARRPIPKDLKYSGDLEQDSDVVLFIHRPDRFLPETEIIVAKQRNGPLDIVPVTYDGARFTFQESFGTEWKP